MIDLSSQSNPPLKLVFFQDETKMYPASANPNHLCVAMSVTQRHEWANLKRLTSTKITASAEKILLAQTAPIGVPQRKLCEVTVALPIEDDQITLTGEITSPTWSNHPEIPTAQGMISMGRFVLPTHQAREIPRILLFLSDQDESRHTTNEPVVCVAGNQEGILTWNTGNNLSEQQKQDALILAADKLRGRGYDIVLEIRDLDGVIKSPSLNLDLYESDLDIPQTQRDGVARELVDATPWGWRWNSQGGISQYEGRRRRTAEAE